MREILLLLLFSLFNTKAIMSYDYIRILFFLNLDFFSMIIGKSCLVPASTAASSITVDAVN